MSTTPTVPTRLGTFTHNRRTLAYTIFGEGRRWVVLLPGLLIPATMQEPLARHLAERGNRVVTMDPLGHGRSERPVDMTAYSVHNFAEEVVALLDHLDIDEAVVGGTSLGANVTLELASMAPQRLRGMIIEMPVLENGLVASAITFAPLLVGLHFGEGLISPVAALLRRIPRRIVPFWGNVALDVIRQTPGPSGALLQGLFFGHVAPHRDQRRAITAPALIIGHHRDPVHPFSDAGMLAEELPNATLCEASHILELRFSPERLSGEIAQFVDRCWSPRVRRQPRPRRKSA
ncbi:MAG: alpha/beta fold hydrolase [Candidatus Dormibacteraeota bacterium]|nr:alpha/beta fold hydrolase [Candidatus Dormibacteraeota bacterium]MBV9526048.1 alpha/beta fold hydrolase [Candidatus Dormibacteraeota bacterium]